MTNHSKLCSKNNIKLKSIFLGPKSENEESLKENINNIFSQWCSWRKKRFPIDGSSITKENLEDEELKKFQELTYELQSELSRRFESEIPKYSPRYMGHMLSEISLPALFGHLVALIHNPNNSVLSTAKVGAQIENETINALSKMIGYKQPGVGHFTSGGTVANIEGLWRARYRLDSNLALAAYLKDKKGINYSIFTASHMNVNEATQKLRLLSTDEETIRKYSFVCAGPYKAASIYSKVFKEDFQGPILIVPGHKHYSWQKAISLMGLSEESLWCVKINKAGRMCLEDLKEKIETAKIKNRPILAVVSVAGTTELGSVDPINKIQDLLDEYKSQSIHIWHHVDAAYGGLYTSMLRGEAELSFKLQSSVIDSLKALERAESVTLDPHKLALVPYACGAILVKDENCYHISQFSAPYLKESKNSGKWNSTLEGSRSATGACATWMVANAIGLNKEGMGEVLALSLGAKKRLEQILAESIPQIRILPQTDTNIICFTFLDNNLSLPKANEVSSSIYKEIIKGDEFSVSQTTLHSELYGDYISSLERQWEVVERSDKLVLIRMVLMNPFSISKENSFDYLLEFTKYLKEVYSRHSL